MHFLLPGSTTIAVTSRKGNWRPERLSWEEFTEYEKKSLDIKDFYSNASISYSIQLAK